MVCQPPSYPSAILWYPLIGLGNPLSAMHRQDLQPDIYPLPVQRIHKERFLDWFKTFRILGFPLILAAVGAASFYVSHTHTVQTQVATIVEPPVPQFHRNTTSAGSPTQPNRGRRLSGRHLCHQQGLLAARGTNSGQPQGKATARRRLCSQATAAVNHHQRSSGRHQPSRLPEGSHGHPYAGQHQSHRRELFPA